jgi:hypothetical protein
MVPAKSECHSRWKHPVGSKAAAEGQFGWRRHLFVPETKEIPMDKIEVTARHQNAAAPEMRGPASGADLLAREVDAAVLQRDSVLTCEADLGALLGEAYHLRKVLAVSDAPDSGGCTIQRRQHDLYVLMAAAMPARSADELRLKHDLLAGVKPADTAFLHLSQLVDGALAADYRRLAEAAPAPRSPPFRIGFI